MVHCRDDRVLCAYYIKESIMGSTLAFLQKVEPWNYPSVEEKKDIEPICPCCRKAVVKGSLKVVYGKDILHKMCSLINPNM